MNLDLGGYGLYVWPAYGIAALVLLGLLIAALASLRAHETALTRLPAARPAQGPLADDPLRGEDGRGDGG